jgi:hypothetical protein
MRIFLLKRNEDVHGMSGTGIVAEGVQFRDGAVVMRWLGDEPTFEILKDIGAVAYLHGHGGKTVVVWLETSFAVEATNSFMTVDLALKKTG